jgi:hypothetical protein
MNGPDSFSISFYSAIYWMRWISLKIHSDAPGLVLARQESCTFDSLTPLLTALPRSALAASPAIAAMILRSDKYLSIVPPWEIFLRWLIGDRYGGERRVLVPVEMNWYDSVPRVTITNCDQNSIIISTILDLYCIVLV